jgi:four helix bundle protein
MKISRFEEIDSWKKGRELTRGVYHLAGKMRFSKDVGLRDQIQRASVSIMSNIAEGFDSGSNRAFENFLRYSYRSASEVQSLLYVALDSGYIDQHDFEVFYNQSSEIKKLIGGFIRYLGHSGRNICAKQ